MQNQIKVKIFYTIHTLINNKSPIIHTLNAIRQKLSQYKSPLGRFRCVLYTNWRHMYTQGAQFQCEGARQLYLVTAFVRERGIDSIS